MTDVPERPRGANPIDSPARHADLGDPTARAEWLAALRVQADDATAAGLDATAPPALRVLGRRAARQKILAARHAMRTLFAAAEFASDDRDHDERRTATGVTAPVREHEASAEMRTLNEAWSDIRTAGSDDDIRTAVDGAPLVGVLFAATVGTPYELAEIDSPGVAVLHGVRDTVDGWAHAQGASTQCASISFADLALLGRRIDAAIAIFRRSGSAEVMT